MLLTFSRKKILISSYGFISRSPDRPTFDSGFSDVTTDSPSLTTLGNQDEKPHYSVPPLTDILRDKKTMSDSRALIAMPTMSLEALAVVPMNMKTNRSDLVQRRTRRPFSVSEVEALVHAVEELGTGRFDAAISSFTVLTVAHLPHFTLVHSSGSIRRISFFFFLFVGI